MSRHRLAFAIALLCSFALSRAQTKVMSPEGPRFDGAAISLDFKDADVRDVLRFLAEFGGKNLVLHTSVQGTITIKLTDVPWDQALDVIMRNNGLGVAIEGNVVRVAATSVLVAEESARRRLAEEKALEVPLMTVTRTLSYAKAQDVAKLIEPFLSKRGTITVDRRTNTLIIQDVPQNLAEAETRMALEDR